MGYWVTHKTDMKVLIIISTVLACSLSKPQGYPQEPSYPDEPPKYQFTYGVQDPDTGNNYGQQESRDGESTQGEYFVNLPDGRLQKVTYTVSGDGGYIAELPTLERPSIRQNLQVDTRDASKDTHSVSSCTHKWSEIVRIQYDRMS